jgi:hypothetical protein
VEDRATESNLSSPNDGNEEKEQRNKSDDERTEEPRNVRRKKETKISCEESLLQILREKKSEDTDVDEDE